MPTDKRQRQKEGRQRRLEAQRKAQRRKQNLRRVATVLVIAAIVGYVAYKVAGPSTPGKTGPAVRQVTLSEISAIRATNTGLAAIIQKNESLTKAQVAAAQNKAKAKWAAAGCPSSITKLTSNLSWHHSPTMTIKTSGTYSAVVTTDVGSFTIALNAKDDPITVNNFVFLAKSGYYNCVLFHRVIPLFMDQSGDPTGTGMGGPGYAITTELPEKASNALYQYLPGDVAMASISGRANSGGSQFFVVTGAEGEGLPDVYADFGTVTKGIDVVAEINGQANTSTQKPTVYHRILKVTVTGPTS